MESNSRQTARELIEHQGKTENCPAVFIEYIQGTKFCFIFFIKKKKTSGIASEIINVILLRLLVCSYSLRYKV